MSSAVPDVPWLKTAPENPGALIVTPDNNGWESPTPLAEFDPPLFPMERLSGAFCDFVQYVRHVQKSVQVPVDLPAMLGIGVLGAALAKRAEINVRADHTEPLNVFTAVAMPPASRKSAVFRLMTAPLLEYERIINERIAPEVEKRRSDRAVLEARLKCVQSKAGKTDDPQKRECLRDEAAKIAETLRTLPNPSPCVLVADDATPEAVGKLLAEHDGRMAIASPEGDVFDLMAGRYSSGNANLGVYLKGHAGDDLRVHRIAADRVPEYVSKPALTMILAVQPEIIRGLARRQGFRGRGLIGRFLYSFPDPGLGRRDDDPPAIPDNVSEAYRRMLFRVLDLPVKHDHVGDPVPCTIRLSPEAWQRLRVFHRRVEAGLAEGGEFAAIPDWAGKLIGAVCRIAGIFHGTLHATPDGLSSTQVCAKTMDSAISIGEYLIHHARAAFVEMGADPEIDIARRIIRWLPTWSGKRFSRRDLHLAQRGIVHRVTDLDGPLRLVKDHGYIRECEVEYGSRGRPPGPVFEIHPEISSC